MLRTCSSVFPGSNVEVEIFALKNICDFSNPAKVEIFANRNYLQFFIQFESLKGKSKPIAKVYFCDHTISQKNAFKISPQTFPLLQQHELNYVLIAIATQTQIILEPFQFVINMGDGHFIIAIIFIICTKILRRHKVNSIWFTLDQMYLGL